MLRTDTMPRTYHTPFKQGECGLNRIGVNVALYVDSELVANRLVLSLFAQMLRRAFVRLKVICEQYVHVIGDILADVLFKRSRLHIFGVKEPQVPSALPDTNHYFFVGQPVFFALSFPANIGFVHFDFSAKLGFIGLDHCSANAMAEVPRGLVGLNSERALNLAGAHALLGFTQQDRREEPRGKREMRIMEDGIHGHAELVFA